jgi:hypothetical protein
MLSRKEFRTHFFITFVSNRNACQFHYIASNTGIGREKYISAKCDEILYTVIAE